MKSIYKYNFEVRSIVKIEMQKGAEIISVALDARGIPSIWAIVDLSEGTEGRVFTVAPTGGTFGNDVLDRQLHVGSFVDGNFVWHVFEMLK